MEPFFGWKVGALERANRQTRGHNTAVLHYPCGLGISRMGASLSSGSPETVAAKNMLLTMLKKKPRVHRPFDLQNEETQTWSGCCWLPFCTNQKGSHCKKHLRICEKLSILPVTYCSHGNDVGYTHKIPIPTCDHFPGDSARGVQQMPKASLRAMVFTREQPAWC